MGGLSSLEVAVILAVCANLLLVILLAGLMAWIYRQSGLPKKREATPGEPEPEAGALANNILLSEMLAEVSQHSIEPLDRALNQSFELVSSIDELADEGYPAWKLEHQAEIDALIASRNELACELDEFKGKLARAHKLVTTLHAQNRQAQNQGEKLSTLHVKVQHLKESLEQLQSQREQDLGEVTELRRQLKLSKRELREAETHARAAEEQGRLQEVKYRRVKEDLVQLQAQREQDLAEAVDLRRLLDEARQLAEKQAQQHLHEVEERNRLQTLLREEVELLRVQLEREREVLSRTLVEKDFIESAFLETDAATEQLLKFKSDYEDLQKAHRLLQLKANIPTS